MLAEVSLNDLIHGTVGPRQIAVKTLRQIILKVTVQRLLAPALFISHNLLMIGERRG